MNSPKIVIVGHSLTDPHIRHLLTAAKIGAGVMQPVVWIAPNVTQRQSQEYLEKYRVRVVSYKDDDGAHANLVSLLEHISDFIPAREGVQINREIAAITASPLGQDAAAPGFFVFTRLEHTFTDQEKRKQVIIAAIAATLEKNRGKEFTLGDALRLAGWPDGVHIDEALSNQIQSALIQAGVIVGSDGKFTVGNLETYKEGRARFEHSRERWPRFFGHEIGPA